MLLADEIRQRQAQTRLTPQRVFQLIFGTTGDVKEAQKQEAKAWFAEMDYQKQLDNKKQKFEQRIKP